jgi:type VI secretion system VasD/TssJ family lipoprotein
MHCRPFLRWAFAAVALLQGCGSVNSMMGGNSEQEAKAAMQWSYARSAITINLRSDPKLNLYYGSPHTLVLAVAQVTDPNVFKTLLSDEIAVSRLLATGQGGPAMLAVDRLIVEPGRTQTVQLDRAQMAQYFGIIAGYYLLEPIQNARLFKIPVDVKSSGWVIKNRTAAPAPQRVNIVLGADRLMAAEQVEPALLAAEQQADPRAKPESGPVNIDANDVRQAADVNNATRRLAK